MATAARSSSRLLLAVALLLCVAAAATFVSAARQPTNKYISYCDNLARPLPAYCCGKRTGEKCPDAAGDAWRAAPKVVAQMAAAAAAAVDHAP